VRNEAFKKELKDHGIYLWEVAEQLGVSDKTMQLWLRKELSEEDKERFRIAARAAAAAKQQRRED